MKKVGLFFGGLSNESEVSITSAFNIAQNFDLRKYKLVLVYWNKKDGGFYLVKSFEEIKKRKLSHKINLEDFKKYFDVAFLITHGKHGEDGVLQGILESQKIKYTGCHVLSSALCMDKGLFKTLVGAWGLPQVRFESLDFQLEEEKIILQKIKKVKDIFKLPVFVKPANSGSSVGISKVKSWLKLQSSIKAALKHDAKVVIEEGVENTREIEVAILGNDRLIISPPGEVKPSQEFYDYNDKYKLDKTEFDIPAKLLSSQIKKIQKIAERAYRLCGCSGFARVDFFVKNDKIYLNEINTLPGFTKISMFPRLIMNRGFSYQQLITKIVELAY